MFSGQQQQLSEAIRSHNAAVARKRVVAQRLAKRCDQFLGKPLNLLFPFAAGALVCASQLKNDAKGVRRIPLLNIANAAVGGWALINRFQRLTDIQSDQSDRPGNAAQSIESGDGLSNTQSNAQSGADHPRPSPPKMKVSGDEQPTTHPKTPKYSA